MLRWYLSPAIHFHSFFRFPQAILWLADVRALLQTFLTESLSQQKHLVCKMNKENYNFFRPPLPPKPRNIVSPSQQPQRTPSMSRGLLYHGRTDIVDGGPPKWVGQEPDTEASEKELIRELLYVFQVCTNPLYKIKS